MEKQLRAFYRNGVVYVYGLNYQDPPKHIQWLPNDFSETIMYEANKNDKGDNSEQPSTTDL